MNVLLIIYRSSELVMPFSIGFGINIFYILYFMFIVSLSGSE